MNLNLTENKSPQNGNYLLEVKNVSRSFFSERHSGLLYEQVESAFFKNSAPKADENRLPILRDISFQIRAGEIIAIIGKNGAGKTTLFRILAGTLSPTQGEIVRHCPLVPVLEMGIGVHTELDGFANFLLEGTARGWKLKDLKSKAAEILEYSGLEKELHKPLKYFSAGMVGRLSLSLALFREKALFLMDEVFGAGDQEFRDKNEVTLRRKAEEGCAFVVVSHNAEFIKRVCNRVLYLKEGRIVFDGAVEEGLRIYQGK
jgi:ABC-type polysaccharide/polyol phosphate transport system ATPase subunit